MMLRVRNRASDDLHVRSDVLRGAPHAANDPAVTVSMSSTVPRAAKHAGVLL